jgi:hypothetical protein
VGHVCLQGNYSAALNDYFHAYKQARTEPLVLLCVAVTLLNQVMSKKVDDRDRAVLQVFALLQVRCCHPVLYQPDGLSIFSAECAWGPATPRESQASLHP